MLQMRVNLQLSSELEYNIRIDYLLFGDNLESDNHLRLSFPCQVNMTILALSHMPSYLKVIQVPFAWMKHSDTLIKNFPWHGVNEFFFAIFILATNFQLIKSACGPLAWLIGRI
jgi:hypothetical protein